MINRDALFTSGRGDYETPPALVGRIKNVTPLTLDVCACKDNAKAPLWIDEQENALSYAHWAVRIADANAAFGYRHGAGWMNPVYGRNMGAWVQRAWATFREHENIVGLLPARTETKWVQDYVFLRDSRHLPAPAMLFLYGRVSFYLPCLICGQRTLHLYQFKGPDMTWLASKARMTLVDLASALEEYQIKSVPLCREHTPPDNVKHAISTAPFPSVVVFWLQRGTLSEIGGYRGLSQQFDDLGKLLYTV